MGYYLHDVPGRLRVRIPSLKRNSQRVTDIQVLSKSIPGIKSTSVNTLTGSVVFHYQTGLIGSLNILSVLRKEGFLDSKTPIQKAKGVNEVVDRLGREASKVLLGLALNKALEGSPLSMVTLFI